MFIDLFSLALLLGYTMLIWFRTDALMEYMGKADELGLPLPQRFKEYLEVHRNGYEGNFPAFLLEYYKDRFFVRLLTCAICVSCWVGLPWGLFRGWHFFLAAPLALLFYRIFDRLI